MKLRLLNGTHSLIAYLGALDGRETIPESIAQSHIEVAARAVLREEYLPTLALPSDVDVDHYEAELFVRWQNSALAHRTSQVGTDGSVKLPQRISAPVLHHLAGDTVPHHLALTVAAYVCCVAPPEHFDAGPHARAMRDPAAQRLRALSTRYHPSGELARAVFEQANIFPAYLAEQERFVSRVGELIEVIRKHGSRAGAEEAAQAASGELTY